MNRIIKYLSGWRESWLLSYRPFRQEIERYGGLRLIAAGIVIGACLMSFLIDLFFIYILRNGGIIG